MIDPAELHSLAHSTLAKRKADIVIACAARWLHASDVDEEFPDRDLEDEHRTVEYRLVPVRVLEQATETIKVLSDNYQKLMVEMAPLIIEATARDDGNRWNQAAKALGQALEK